MKNDILKWIMVFVLAAGQSTLTGAADDLSIRAYVDNTVIGLNQQFTLNVELSGADAGRASNPVLPGMDDFARFLGSGSSQSFQFINGKMSVSKTLSYHFQASAEGTHQIGAVTVTHQGKTIQTEPIPIQIRKGTGAAAPPASGQPQEAPAGVTPDGDDLFIRAEADKQRVYQNEPVIVTYKLYTRLNVASYGLTQLPETAGFWTEEFPLPRQPEVSREVLDGRQYTVAVIKKMALFPTGSGKKTIGPMGVQCDVRVRERSRGVFDDFFNDSFMLGRTQRRSLQSNAITIQVNPLPEAGRPADFSGVVGRFSISGSVDKADVRTNEAITCKIVIRGQGNIRTLPDPDIRFPTDFEVYPPKTSIDIEREGNTISGTKTYEYVLVPRVPGLQKIQPVRLSVFDPAANSYKTLQTREISIQVARGSEPLTTVPSGLSKEEVRLIGQDIRFIKTRSTGFQRIGSAVYKKGVFWAVLLVPLLFAGAAWLYRNHLNRMQDDVAYARSRRAGRAARRRFAGARANMTLANQKTFYAEVSRALTGYMGNKLNMAESGMISDQVRKDLMQRGVPADVISEVFDCLHVCDMKRFSPAETDESEMKVFLQRSEKALSRLDKALTR